MVNNFSSQGQSKTQNLSSSGDVAGNSKPEKNGMGPECLGSKHVKEHRGNRTGPGRTPRIITSQSKAVIGRDQWTKT